MGLTVFEYLNQRSKLFRESRTYIKDPSSAPKGVSVKRGPRGGYYYDDGSSSDGSQGSAKKASHVLGLNELHNNEVIQQSISNAMADLDPEQSVKLQKIFAKVRSGGSTRDVFRNSDGSYQERRASLHSEIIDSFFVGKSPVDNPEAIFAGGIPGSGKSTMLKAAGIGDNYVLLNSDEIKVLLPEYDGGDGAALVHEESSEVMMMMLRRAQSEGYNVIVDGTLKSTDKARSLVKKMKGRGYRTNVMFTQLPTHKAIERAHARYKEEGRFVDYRFIADTTPGVLESRDELRSLADSFSVYDTDVPFGSPVVRVEKMSDRVVFDDDVSALFHELDDSELDFLLDA